MCAARQEFSMSAANEHNRPSVMRAHKPDMRDDRRNNSAFSLIRFSLARFQSFCFDWALTSLKQCRGAFRLTLNPQKGHVSLWIWLWKFSHWWRRSSQICICIGSIWIPGLEYWSLNVTPFGCVVCGWWSHLWHKASRIWVLHSHAENPQSMRWSFSHPESSGQSLRCLLQWMRISSFLQRGSRQLVGQRVPALHLLALVLQTVYPVLQRVSLRVTP